MNIDYKISQKILDNYNKGIIGFEPKTTLKEIPSIDNKQIIDLKNISKLKFSTVTVENAFKKYNLPSSLLEECCKSSFNLDSTLLNKIGIHLYPFFSFGVLNGGSATSYVDKKNNIKFDKELFYNLKSIFSNLTESYKNKPKGITPAFINPNGTPGASFMELKMRALLLEAKKYSKITGKSCKTLFPMFQMTSTSNNQIIRDYYKQCSQSIYLKELIHETGNNITSVKTGIQPLISAFTHSNKGDKKDFFKNKDGEFLGLPGGHGQCFKVLKEVFVELYNTGIRFISIGNVDNIGYSVDPKTLAIMALTGKQAGFDFSFKTQFDVKGGILIRDQFGRINCADLGVAVSKDDVEVALERDIPVLFNCATGIFNLEYIIENLENITSKLPTRFSDQNKDAGLYSQAEQVTWEIISILDDFQIFAVDKYDKFLASKLLIENLVTSGLAKDITNKDLSSCAKALNKGLKNKLKHNFNLKLVDGEWRIND